jgi:hypothetical protein
MKYVLYDHQGKIFGKYWDIYEASKFIQKGWKLVTKARITAQEPKD